MFRWVLIGPAEQFPAELTLDVRANDAELDVRLPDENQKIAGPYRLSVPAENQAAGQLEIALKLVPLNNSGATTRISLHVRELDVASSPLALLLPQSRTVDALLVARQGTVSKDQYVQALDDTSYQVVFDESWRAWVTLRPFPSISAAPDTPPVGTSYRLVIQNPRQSAWTIKYRVESAGGRVGETSVEVPGKGTQTLSLFPKPVPAKEPPAGGRRRGAR